MADALGKKAVALVAVGWRNIGCSGNGSCTARWSGFSTRLAASVLPLSCCVAGVKSAFTALSVSNVLTKNSFQEPLEPGTAFALWWREMVRSSDAPVNTRVEKICAAIRPLALRLLYIPGNARVAGERQPAGGGHSLRRLFQGTSRTTGESAAVLPGEGDNDAAPRSGGRTLSLMGNGIGDNTGESKTNP
jgi:hypothetical protein